MPHYFIMIVNTEYRRISCQIMRDIIIRLQPKRENISYQIDNIQTCFVEGIESWHFCEDRDENKNCGESHFDFFKIVLLKNIVISSKILQKSLPSL